MVHCIITYDQIVYQFKFCSNLYLLLQFFTCYKNHGTKVDFATFSVLLIKTTWVVPGRAHGYPRPFPLPVNQPLYLLHSSGPS